jgi:hypothetical protein
MPTTTNNLFHLLALDGLVIFQSLDRHTLLHQEDWTKRELEMSRNWRHQADSAPSAYTELFITSDAGIHDNVACGSCRLLYRYFEIDGGSFDIE